MDVQSDTKVGKDRPAGGRRFAWAGAGIRLFILLLIGALIFVVMREWDWWVGSAALQSTDDAYLQADTTPLAAKVPGYVSRVLVQDFQRVHGGDVLVEIVDDDYRAQLDQAQANVVAAGAAIDNIEQQKRLQETLVKQAEAEIAGERGGRNALSSRDGAPRDSCYQELRRHAAACRTGRRQRKTRDLHSRAEPRQARSAASATQCLGEPEGASRRGAGGTKGARNLAAINLGYTRIVAPVDGMVSERRVRPGQYLSVGTQVISLVPLPNVWVIANYKETQMTNIRTGQKARVTVDAFPGKVLHGQVDSWSPASGAEFALLPPDNATGNFTKVVQRIPVKIVLDRDPSLADLLRPGMSVIATIDTSSKPPDSGVGAK